jgi:hypothetical protein
MLVVLTLSLVLQRSARAQDSTARAQGSTTRAQDSTTVQRDGWIVGPLVGLPGAGSEAAYPLVTLGIGVTRLVPNRMGLDFAVGTAPRVMLDGLFPVAARVGPSIALPIGRDAFFIPSGGLSVVGIAGAGGVGGVVGWYTGAAAVLAYKSVGLRAGATLHVMNGAMTPLWLAEIGIVSVPLPRLVH